MTPSPSVTPLDQEVAEGLRHLRSSLAELLESLPERAEKAIDLERFLGLDKKSAWQVFRIVQDADPLASGLRLPGTAAVKRLVERARKKGVPGSTCTRVTEAASTCQAIVGRHAGDRSTFDLMVSAVTGDGLESRNLDLKRSAFRVNRQVHGKQCEVDLFTLLVVPGHAPDHVHLCSVRGLRQLCSFRPVTALEISRHRFDDASGRAQTRERVDPSDLPVPILSPFCSSPLPAIRQVTGPDGFVRTLVETEFLGERAAVTCYLADVVRESPLRGAGGDEPRAVGHIHEVATPSRVLYHDVLIDESLAVTPTLRVLANRRDAGTWPADDPTPLLPIQEAVHLDGQGPAAVSTPEVPGYREMIEYVTGKLDWDAERLLLYRARIEYPVLDSVVWMRFDLESASRAER